MSEFKEGEKVEVTNRISKYSGKPAEILKVDGNYAFLSGEDLEVDKYKGVWFPFDELKKVKQNNMSDFTPFYVEVDGPNHSRILQEIAFKEGYEWFDSKKQVSHTDRSRIGFKKEYIYRGIAPSGEFEKLEDPTLEEFRQALRGNYDFEETIEIGEYEVEFKTNEIKVGCEPYRRNRIEHVYEAHKIGQDATHGDSSLNFKLHHPDVGEIPFDKIEKIYNRINK